MSQEREAVVKWYLRKYFVEILPIVKNYTNTAIFQTVGEYFRQIYA